MNKLIASGALSGALLFGVACGEAAPQTPDTTFTIDDLFESQAMKVIRPGQTQIVEAETNSSFRSNVRDNIQIVDHQYGRGLTDDSAPEVSHKPLRVDAHVALKGEGPSLSNDLACDTLKVDTHGFSEINIFIGAVAISDEASDTVLVSWPHQEDGSPGSNVYVCMDNGKEPADGVVLVVSDQPR